ncbi:MULTISPECIES: helix-turn-helix transcriptional regulator [Nocardioides]|nr:helix-turn-helix transcriptional regulator [Nocardioides sp. CGMCC 1.13656]
MLAAQARLHPAVLSVTLEVLHAIAEGVPSKVALCRCLARATEAAVVAHVELDPTAGTMSIVSWPGQADLVRAQPFLDTLPAVVPHLIGMLSVDRHARRLSAEFHQLGWQATVAAMLLEDVLGCSDVAEVPLDVGGPELRLVVLGSRDHLCAPTVQLLDCLRGPLSDLIRIAAPDAAAPDHRIAPSSGLTQREIEVLRLMAEGLLARTIALRLRVSPRTVHKHLGNIYRKLDAHDRLVAVRRAEGLGLLDRATGDRPALADGLLTLWW